jgi:hypothetical protein
MYSGLTYSIVSFPSASFQSLPYLDPIFIPPVQYVLRVWVLQDKPLSAVLHDVLHPFADIPGRPTLELSNELDPAPDLFHARSEVAFPEFGRLVDEGHAVEIE